MKASILSKEEEVIQLQDQGSKSPNFTQANLSTKSRLGKQIYALVAVSKPAQIFE